jgi:hypothetical protein
VLRGDVADDGAQRGDLPARAAHREDDVLAVVGRAVDLAGELARERLAVRGNLAQQRLDLLAEPAEQLGRRVPEVLLGRPVVHRRERRVDAPQPQAEVVDRDADGARAEHRVEEGGGGLLGAARLALARDLDDDRGHPEQLALLPRDRIEAREPVPLDSRHRRRLTGHLALERGLAGLDHAAHDRLDLATEPAEQLRRRAADVVGRRDAVDRGERGVDAAVAQAGVPERQPDRRVGEQRVEDRVGVGGRGRHRVASVFAHHHSG